MPDVVHDDAAAMVDPVEPEVVPLLRLGGLRGDVARHGDRYADNQVVALLHLGSPLPAARHGAAGEQEEANHGHTRDETGHSPSYGRERIQLDRPAF
jgi:hypothetical protein